MFQLRMKKIDPTSKKNDSVHSTKQSQKKISLYFAKASKDDASKKNGTLTIDNYKQKNNLSTGASSTKRKKSRKVQEPIDESDIIYDNMFCDKVEGIEDASPKENIINAEYKENLCSGGCETASCKTNGEIIQSQRHDNALLIIDDNNFINTYIRDNNKDAIKNADAYSDDKQLDELEKCYDKSDSVLETCIIDDFNDCFEEEWSPVSQLNFNSLQRCKVTHIERRCNDLSLTVEDEEDSALSDTVLCSGFWKDAKLEENDIVAIQARKENSHWVVDNNSGFLVVHPDVLISGTTIVGALFCSRKAVLAEKFRKLETLPFFKGDQTALVVGSLAHQLLQKAMSRNICQISDIRKLMDSILQSKETTDTLYASEIEFNRCKEQMLTLVPRISEFIQHYLKDKKQQEISSRKDNFKGKITHIYDIEENIWLPKLGMKGKVDATVEVSLNSNRRIMPLEIKTGKPSFSLEHRGQIILYIMMMALTGQDTDTGLLLYLRENNMQEIKGVHPEKRDLVLLRNTLANYFAPKSVEKLSNFASESNGQTLELPEPINHHSACSKCSYNALCCAYLNRDTGLQLSESHPLTKLGREILNKISSAHIDYLMKWVSLLQIEETAQSSGVIIKHMWMISPEKREAKKTCISNLKVIGKVVEYDSKYQHTLVRANSSKNHSNIAVLSMEFTENEYILVSTNKRINISAGFIVNIKEDSVTVLLDRDITKYNIDEFFHIDKYSSSGLFSFNLANVGGLMSDNEVCEKLRNIVIDKKPATFVKELPHSITVKSAPLLKGLNENQQRAVLKAMTANDYILIKGMPGTGKTQTLVALIQLLHATGHSVLITAHTNSAVDNILLRLLNKGIDFLRLGSSIYSSLKHASETYATANCDSPESLEKVYSSKNVVGVTCYGAHHALLGKRTFDVCVVDESAQALQPAVLRPLYSARKFVLVGDPDQLPPIIKSKVARKLGADESLFARLDSDNNTVKLTKQYRMNKDIMRLANKLTYNDMLEAGNTLIENATLNATHINNLLKQERWIQKVLSQDINDSVIILNTGCINDLKTPFESNDKYSKINQKCSNIWEAAIISKLLKTMLEVGVKLQNVGVIAPYRAHVSLLKEIVNKDVEVNTVDQYQGRDKDIIIYSCARSLSDNSDIKEDLEILGDHRRLTVAITRAKHKLIVVVDKYTLSKYTAFKKLFNLVEEKNIINLCDGQNDFSWKSLMSLL
ncbi:DNA replication helicase/nuclease 2 isoform X2 [Nomia melanderi]|uniref:DNA replication helicase/nuclease 2 isoform X2 n=1 Tax=Nomia melanderi TaxID=2448451 RepID=UPI003FCECCA0